MELYTLDDSLRRAAVIDRFESMIWTERFVGWGDFELYIHSTADTRRLLPAGTRLAMSDSYRVMVVEFIENSTDDEGREMLKVSGRSLEYILDDRVARNSFADLTTLPRWVLTGTPGDIARQVFDSICRNNSFFPDDQIPLLQPGSIFPPGTILETDDVITIELELDTVYNVIKEICEVYGLGFRLLRKFDTSQLYFDIYAGNDRTSQQTFLAPVIFAPNLDNLTNISEVTSISGYKNVAYVYHPQGVQIVTVEDVSVEVEGFERRVMLVDASDIELPERAYSLTIAQINSISVGLAIPDITDPLKHALMNLKDKIRLTSAQVTLLNNISGGSVNATVKSQIVGAVAVSVAYNDPENAYLWPLLQKRGKEELAKNRAVSAFDGELPMNSPYPYEIAYQLGDLIEMRNIDGITNQMRVQEQIFVSDAAGERAYPTLAIDRFITPGSWMAWDYNQVWLDADGTWSEA